jgi:hypothetical protein
MNSQTKLEYYNILNSVRMVYLKSKVPFSIVNSSDIKLTYKNIKLKYINDKNYFVKVDKSKNYKEDRIPWTKEQKKEFYKQKAKEERNLPKINLNEPWTTEKRDEYRKQVEESGRSKSPQSRDSSRDRNERTSEKHQSPRREFTAEETAAYLERKKRREQSPQSRYSSRDRNERTSEKHQSPRREFTAEETAAYLERKKRREQSPQSRDSSRDRNERTSEKHQSPRREFTAEETAAYLERKKRREQNNKIGGGCGPIMVFY